MGNPRIDPPAGRTWRTRGGREPQKPIPDTFENVIKALVKPVRKGKPTGAEDSS